MGFPLPGKVAGSFWRKGYVSPQRAFLNDIIDGNCPVRVRNLTADRIYGTQVGLGLSYFLEVATHVQSNEF
ncbi:hypothetical protein SAMN06269250_2765 [Spirosoma fluviale]|uniref:Uncharacterized protein n=1 Tax=Spirosoma fluviale TaxID=1597977 RepID=A0A286FZG4_9BACT|nr:hypothetical protein SAMN06269250_2765 [Spirosoma fluviale]